MASMNFFQGESRGRARAHRKNGALEPPSGAMLTLLAGKQRRSGHCCFRDMMPMRVHHDDLEITSKAFGRAPSRSYEAIVNIFNSKRSA
jgi:hypothetical protein